MEAKNNILLVPTDFSEVGTNAINLAAKAAKLLDYKMCLLHITDGADATVEEKLNVLAAEAKDTYGIKVDTIAREGSIYSTIGVVAKEINAALVYLGTHGKVGMQKNHR
jgi:nucleotide-binding universal stress UspA family protein